MYSLIHLFFISSLLNYTNINQSVHPILSVSVFTHYLFFHPYLYIYPHSFIFHFLLFAQLYKPSSVCSSYFVCLYMYSLFIYSFIHIYTFIHINLFFIPSALLNYTNNDQSVHLNLSVICIQSVNHSSIDQFVYPPPAYFSHFLSLKSFHLNFVLYSLSLFPHSPTLLSFNPSISIHLFFFILLLFLINTTIPLSLFHPVHQSIYLHSPIFLFSSSL